MLLFYSYVNVYERVQVPVPEVLMWKLDGYSMGQKRSKAMNLPYDGGETLHEPAIVRRVPGFSPANDYEYE